MFLEHLFFNYGYSPYTLVYTYQNKLGKNWGTMSNKYNIVMPETDDSCLCLQIEREISGDGYKENFLNRVDKMLAVYGEIRFLIYYKNFSGWDKEAAMLDISANARLRDKIHKVAMVNAPESEAMRGLMREGTLSGHIRMFEEHELEEALIWVKS